MKRPRISISGLMGVVLLVAIDLAIVKALFGPPMLLRMPLTELLVIAVFPMANILAIGLVVLILTRRDPRANRPALVGFEAFGLAAWVVLLACSLAATHFTYDLPRPAVRASGLPPGLALASFVGLLYLVPQLAIAAMGWKFGRIYRVRWSFSIDRRVEPKIRPVDLQTGLGEMIPGVTARA